ncbi:hypothetical protein J5690_05180 [bacterium]|nr:hypothetical protein [bacterium]
MKDNFGNNIICESEGKICYNKKEARTALNGAKHHGNRAKKIPKRMYPCKKCGHYHLTSQKSEKTDHSKLAYYQKRNELILFEYKKLWREEYSFLCVA